jgi:hypothetical protein
MYLAFGPSQTLAEIVRLSLIAFLTTLFFTHPDLNSRRGFLAVRLRSIMDEFHPETTEEKYVYSWCLVMLAMAVLDDKEDDWLRNKFNAIVADGLGPTWLVAQDRLQQFVWIDGLHDAKGARIYARYLD